MSIIHSCLQKMSFLLCEPMPDLYSSCIKFLVIAHSAFSFVFSEGNVSLSSSDPVINFATAEYTNPLNS